MIKAENISFSYQKGKHVLDRVSFSLSDGQSLAILGNNGAGKSTLLKCIDRILKPESGTVLVDGENVYDMSGTEMARKIAYVPQHSHASDMTVFDAVLLGRKPYIKWDAAAEDRQIVSEILHQMKLEDYALRNISELSGGEAQKVMLARALAQQPKVLLLDEPTSSLDPRNQHEVLQLVRSIAKEKQISVITVLHDLNLAIRYYDRFFVPARFGGLCLRRAGSDDAGEYRSSLSDACPHYGLPWDSRHYSLSGSHSGIKQTDALQGAAGHLVSFNKKRWPGCGFFTSSF